MADYILDAEDRAFFEEHYRWIAGRLRDKGLWAGSWRVEVDGAVFAFKARGYAPRAPRRGNPGKGPKS